MAIVTSNGKRLEKQTVSLDKLRPVREPEALEYEVGQRVDVFFPKLDKSWWEGHIVFINGNMADVRFTSGCNDGEPETVNLKNLRTSIHF